MNDYDEDIQTDFKDGLFFYAAIAVLAVAVFTAAYLEYFA